MITFREYANSLINEVKDTRRNREQMIQSYGLMDHAPEHVAQERAKELIDKFTKLEPLIDPNHDYFGVPGKKYNPKDIFSWARLSKDMGYDKLEALQNFEAMLIDLGRASDRKEQTKLSEKDYDILADTEHATLYRPKSMAASCKLGAGTKWCTAASNNNQFDSYMAQGVVLFYAITKAKETNTAQAVWPPKPAGGAVTPRDSDYQSQEKFAIAMYPDGETFEFFDEQDNKISEDDWYYEFKSLGLPTNLNFYKKHGPSPISLLRQSAVDAQSKLSGRVARSEFDEETNWELLNDVLDRVKRIFKDQDPEQIEQLKKYRADEGMPDEVFLMDVFDSNSMEYFTDQEYNPPGSNNWGNAQFQQEIVRNVKRLTYLTKQLNDRQGSEDDGREMDDINRLLYGPNDSEESQNRMHMLIGYVVKHMNGSWPELEKALIDMWMNNHASTDMVIADGYSEHSQQPFQDSMMWLRLVMKYKDYKWPELEQALHTRIKQVLHKKPNDENLTRGLINMGKSFNLLSNIGIKTTEMLAHVPETKDHLLRYAGGEWDIDGPPLTDRAERELKWRKTGT